MWVKKKKKTKNKQSGIRCGIAGDALCISQCQLALYPVSHMYKGQGLDYKSDLSSGQNLTVVAWQTYYIHFVLVVINANNCIGFF